MIDSTLERVMSLRTVTDVIRLDAKEAHQSIATEKLHQRPRRSYSISPGKDNQEEKYSIQNKELKRQIEVMDKEQLSPSEEEALAQKLALQTRFFGIDMLEELEPDDESEVLYLCSLGYTFLEAAEAVFNRKRGLKIPSPSKKQNYADETKQNMFRRSRSNDENELVAKLGKKSKEKSINLVNGTPSPTHQANITSTTIASRSSSTKSIHTIEKELSKSSSFHLSSNNLRTVLSQDSEDLTDSILISSPDVHQPLNSLKTKQQQQQQQQVMQNNTVHLTTTSNTLHSNPIPTGAVKQPRHQTQYSLVSATSNSLSSSRHSTPTKQEPPLPPTSNGTASTLQSYHPPPPKYPHLSQLLSIKQQEEMYQELQRLKERSLAALPESDQIRISLLLSTQEEKYRTNMFDFLVANDKHEIDEWLAKGFRFDDITLYMFRRKYEPLENTHFQHPLLRTIVPVPTAANLTVVTATQHNNNNNNNNNNTISRSQSRISQLSDDRFDEFLTPAETPTHFLRTKSHSAPASMFPGSSSSSMSETTSPTAASLTANTSSNATTNATSNTMNNNNNAMIRKISFIRPQSFIQVNSNSINNMVGSVTTSSPRYVNRMPSKSSIGSPSHQSQSSLMMNPSSYEQSSYQMNMHSHQQQSTLDSHNNYINNNNNMGDNRSAISRATSYRDGSPNPVIMVPRRL
jgi:hypothetical protein